MSSFSPLILLVTTVLAQKLSSMSKTLASKDLEDTCNSWIHWILRLLNEDNRFKSPQFCPVPWFFSAWVCSFLLFSPQGGTCGASRGSTAGKSCEPEYKMRQKLPLPQENIVIEIKLGWLLVSQSVWSSYSNLCWFFSELSVNFLVSHKYGGGTANLCNESQKLLLIVL